jgi:hypothetical protein
MDLLGGYGSSSDEEEDEPTPLLKVNPSRKEVWSENFRKIKEFYLENGHLTLPRTDPEYAKLSYWLTYQRHLATTLRKDQLELLESINYKTAPIRRESKQIEWEVKCNQLKQVYDETSGVKFKIKDHALACWFSKQKRLFMINKLLPSRQEMLRKIGIDLESSLAVPTPGRKKVKSKFFEEKWQSQFEKLKEYKRIHGDCNVPRNWKENYSLGRWVYNQRTQYRRMKTTESVDNLDRFQKLDQLGFGSSVNDATEKENGSNRGSQN